MPSKLTGSSFVDVRLSYLLQGACVRKEKQPRSNQPCGTGKRSDRLSSRELQAGNRAWWSDNPMAYDWREELEPRRFSREWFDAIDARFVYASRLFATDVVPFDRIIPYDKLSGTRVLEVGCGMGLHTEMMSRGGADVTAVDLTHTAVEATTARLALKGIVARIVEADAEVLPFRAESFDFVWSWGVIHHSARTARIVREIARVLRPTGECRVMVYNRNSTSVRVAFLRDFVARGGFLRQSFDEQLYRTSDGFSARFYIREHFEDLFRAFFEHVSSTVCGQDADALPLPRRAREFALRFVSKDYLRRAQGKVGSFIFLEAKGRV